MTDAQWFSVPVAALGVVFVAVIGCRYALQRIRSWITVRRFIRARRNRPLAERLKDSEDQMDSIYPGFTAAFRAEMPKRDATADQTKRATVDTPP